MSENGGHIHYCKDYQGLKVCADRGYCECECGARAGFTLEEGAREWRVPSDQTVTIQKSSAVGKTTDPPEIVQ